jgi:hypothetical protein
MIHVSFQTLIWASLALVCGLLIALWLWSEWQQSARERAARKKLRRCPLCFFEFEPDLASPPPRPCPRCGALTD